MLTVLRLQTGYGTIKPTKAGRDWSAGIRKRYNKSRYRRPDTRSLDTKSVFKIKKFKCINTLYLLKQTTGDKQLVIF